VPPISRPIKRSDVARPTAGKSSLTNRLLGEERSLVHDVAGTTTDPVDTPFNLSERQAIDSRVQSLLAVADAAGKPGFDQLAGITASWYFGANRAGAAMYDPATGVTFDGRINTLEQAQLVITGCELRNSADNLVVARDYSRIVMRDCDLSGSSTIHPAVFADGGATVEIVDSTLHDFPARAIDVEGGAQPLTNEDGSVVTVFNGEIWNHRQRRPSRSMPHRSWSVGGRGVPAPMSEYLVTVRAQFRTAFQYWP